MVATEPAEPAHKRVWAFVDGQNLYRAAMEAWGYHYPNYDFPKLAQGVCCNPSWSLDQVCFYTGIPSQEDDAFWNYFWSKKCAVMGTRRVKVFTRHLRYQDKETDLPLFNTKVSVRVPREKGIDIRIALDVVGSARQRRFDMAVIFSQDQDFSEVADEVRHISCEQGRWIKVASAFPYEPNAVHSNKRGIERTDWIRIDRALYDSCIDPLDYRPPRKQTQMGLPGMAT